MQAVVFLYRRTGRCTDRRHTIGIPSSALLRSVARGNNRVMKFIFGRYHIMLEGVPQNTWANGAHSSDKRKRQESLANAKVSAHQQCVYEGPWEIYGKLTQWVTTLSLIIRFIRLEVVVSQNREENAKFRQNLTLQQFKVIQGHRSWCQSRAHMRLPISH